jgi:Secretion system C-terminal sorting domain
MIKSIIIRVACFCMPLVFSTKLLAQYDANWVLGFDYAWGASDSILYLNFQTDPPARSSFGRSGIGGTAPNYEMSIAPSVISDKVGNLKLYADGTAIFNRDHKIIKGGDSLFLLKAQSGWTHFDFNNIWNGSMFLPFPDHPDSTLYFTQKVIVATDYSYCVDLHYSVINHLGQQGAGEVVDRMHILNGTDSLSCGRFKAVQHANGRDWWVLQSDRSGTNYFMHLLTPDGISLHHTQDLVSTQSTTHWHQTCFSPDGNWFAGYFQLDEGVQLHTWKFDRCEGLLSEFKQSVITSKWKDGGLAFSPSSRFLYVSATDTVYQYDMQENDYLLSKTVVGAWDSVFVDYNVNPNVVQMAALGFRFAQLAPNGKIYISTLYRTNYLNTIHNPDAKGIACNFKQRDVVFNSNVGWSLPNLMHFNTGKLVGSGCDTITSSVVEQNSSPPTLEISPNPSSGQFMVYFGTQGLPENASLVINNLVGQTVKTFSISQQKELIDLSSLEDGIYLIRLITRTNNSTTAKILIHKE